MEAQRTDSERDARALVERAAVERGEPYLRARDLLVLLPAAAWESLWRSLGAEAAGPARVVGEIVRGWRERKPTFEEAALRLRARPKAGAGILAGSPEGRGTAVAAAGSGVAAWCIEAVWKRLYSRDEEPEALFSALAVLADPLGLEPLLELAEPASPPLLRAGALHALGALRDERAGDCLRRAASAEERSAAVRTAALRALGGRDEEPSMAVLAATVADEERAIEERRVAAESLAALGRKTRVALVRPLIASVRDADILETLVALMAAIGEPSDLPALRSAGLRRPELGETADIAARAIEIRAKKPAIEEREPELDLDYAEGKGGDEAG